MKKIWIFKLILIIIVSISGLAQEDYLKIASKVSPKQIKQGEEGILKIMIKPADGIKISSHPEFMIKLDDNNYLTFPKVFFTASELDFQTKQENDIVYLDLDKEIEIPFKVNDNSLIGKHRISGEIIFTAVPEDGWSLKTYQKFVADFSCRRNYKIRR